MSMFSVLVRFNANIIKFTIKITGIITAAIGCAHVPAETAGQPASMIVRFKPNRSTIACAAGPTFVVNTLITKFIPIIPIPTVIPEIIAFFIGTLKIIPTIKMMMGSITLAPAPKILCTTFIKPSI